MGRRIRNLLVLLAAVGLPIAAQRLADHRNVDPYAQTILFKIGLNVTLAVSLSLIIGFTGQFSIGHAGFMSVGAFFSGLCTTHLIVACTRGMDAPFLESDVWRAELLRAGILAFLLTAGAAAAIVTSIVVGLPALRLRGDYLAIATLGFGEIVYNLLLIHLQKSVGDTAFYLPIDSFFLQKSVNIASAWILALLSILVVRNLVSSTSGRALPAIREDEIASAAVGIRTTRYKMLAFVVSAALAGAAGVLDVHQIGTVNPASFRFDRSIEMIVPVVLGGSGSLSGCVLASAGFTYLTERLRDLPGAAQQYRMIVYAGALILVMILRPQGLMGRFELNDLIARWRRKPRSPAVRRVVSPETDEPSPPPHRGDATDATLECSRLTICFGGLTAVNDFNLCLKSREIVGLIGPNGAGKTTCFNMITGIYRPTAGEIRLGDRSILGCGCATTNNLGIARTFQNIRLFSDLSVRDNVRVALHAHVKTGVPAAILRTRAFYDEERRTHDEATTLLDLFGLSHLSDEIAGGLPYGDQRRLEIARALATRPRVLCLDEPAAGMNPVEKRELMDLIRHVRDRFRLTVLLIEHDMKVVMGVCERIVVLDHGETIAEGPPEVIRDDPKVIEAYLGEAPK